jgi:NAD(P)-dependent dehydrogenase (short-subunit alcohol dehydrogenase family)
VTEHIATLQFDDDRLAAHPKKAARWQLRTRVTVQLAWELRDTPIKVNTVNPRYTATDLNSNGGTQTIEEGEAETIRQSLAPDDAPTGGFFETGGVVPW